MSDRLHKIGIIGCGWFAPFHIEALDTLRNRAAIVWAADPELERATDIAARAGARALADYREGLHEVDAVVILVPHHLHHPITMDCLKAGKHVLLEKPLALNLAESDDMIQAADEAKRTLMVAYPHRYRRSMREFRKAVVGGEYGRLIMLDALMDERNQDYISGWIARKRQVGGGVFFSASPHMLDVMLWVAGPARCVSMVGTRGLCEMEGEDTACSIIKFESGAIGVTRHTWSSPKSRIWYTMHAVCERAHITLTTTPMGDLVTEGHRCPWETRVVVEGEETGRVMLHESDEGLDVRPEVSHFLDCVETGQTPQTDGRCAREMIVLLTRAYREADERGANMEPAPATS